MHRSAHVPEKPRPVRGFFVAGNAFVVFKWCVYALLGLDVALYGLHGTVTEQVDTAAWVLLLLLFEWETGDWRMGHQARIAVHSVRVLAIIAIGGSCVAYATQGEWLDFANATTWLAVVLALELEVRIPLANRSFHEVRRAGTLVLYAALASFLVTWLLIGIREGGAGAWLDAWDAALWLLAFAVIELNVFGWGASRGRSRP